MGEKMKIFKTLFNKKKKSEEDLGLELQIKIFKNTLEINNDVYPCVKITVFINDKPFEVFYGDSIEQIKEPMTASDISLSYRKYSIYNHTNEITIFSGNYVDLENGLNTVIKEIKMQFDRYKQYYKENIEAENRWNENDCEVIKFK